MTDPILPGATLGVLGSGQLGRMFAIAATQMGYHVHVYSPDTNTPAGEVSTREFSAPYDDEKSLVEFARSVDVVTFEFENVPSAVSNHIAEHTHIRPSAHVLNVSQNRILEKSTIHDFGLPVPSFYPVYNLDDLKQALTEFDGCGVVKTATSGYDGKGQAVIRDTGNAADVWESLKTNEAILEELVDFDCEISIVGARNPQGETAFYRPFQNSHKNHILDVTVCPARITPDVETEALRTAESLFNQLNVVGVLCVEMFVTRDSRILINEIAPRPHNSGHLTIDAHSTSQFEQQVRAICGLPLGSVHQFYPAAMANLLGDRWESGTPAWTSLCGATGIKLHLYGKRDARIGRKMGHITTVGATVEEAADSVINARDALSPPG